MWGDRKIARLVTDCYNGKVNEENTTKLLNILFDRSKLGILLKRKKSTLEFVNLKSSSETRVTLGEYTAGKNSVKLNPLLLQMLTNKEEHAFWMILDTYGHENTHFWQYLNNKMKEDEKAPDNIALMEKKVKVMCAITDGFEKGEYTNDINYFVYLANSLEVGAREGGANFAKDVLNNLLNNKYLSEEIKKKIASDIEWGIQYKEAKNEKFEEYKELYMVLFEGFKEDLLTKFKHEKDTRSIDEWIVAINVWLSFAQPREVTSAYISLMGKGSEHDELRKRLAHKILSSEFPKEERDELINSVKNRLGSGNLRRIFYEKELLDILSEDEALEIYESLLLNDHDKLSAELFDQFIDEKRACKKMADITERTLPNMKFKSPQEKSCFEYESTLLMYLAGKDKTINDVAFCYVMMSGEKNLYFDVKTRMADFINSAECSEKVRKKFTEYIVECFKSSTVPQRNYNEDIFAVLSDSQLLEIYEYAIKENPSKVNHLFNRLLNHSDKVDELAEVVARNLPNIEVNSEEDLQYLVGISRILAWMYRDELNPKTQEYLKEFALTKEIKPYSKQK